MSEDTKDNAANANNGLTAAFNRDERLAHDIANLSPAGIETCKNIEAVAAQRMETEKRNQQRSHAHRILKTKVELLENYVRDQSERPAEIKADPSADLKVIDEQAERMVREKEAFYLRTIERETEANLRQVVAMERGGHDFSQSEMDREQDMDR